MSRKFSRDDEQILALNYENLCDNDYLHKLFVSDQNFVKDEHSAGEQSKSASESHLSNTEFPEDIIIFGDQMMLGRSLFDRRIRKDLASYLKFQDGLGLQISRQSIIYEHMADVMLRKVADSSTSSIKDANTATKAPTPSNDILRIVLDSLFSIFGDEEILTASNLRSIMDILVKFFDPLSRNQTLSERVNFDKIRHFASKNILTLNSLKLLNRCSWDKVSFREEVKSILYSIYCYVCMGIVSRDISDLVVALDCLIKLHIQVEIRTEDILVRAKESLSTNANVSSTATAPVKATATASMSAVTKKQKKFGKEKPSLLQGGQIDRGDNLDVVENVTVEEISFPAESLENLSTVGSGLKSVGSGNKLNSLKEKGPLPSSKNTDAISREVHKSKSRGKETTGNFSVLVSNHLVMDYSEPIASQPDKLSCKKGKPSHIPSPNLLSNSPPKNEITSIENLNPVFTPRTTNKKIEREVKDCVYEANRVPTILIQLLTSFASAVGKATSKSYQSRLNVVESSSVNKSNTKVWSSGQNSHGELGLGDITTRKSFSRITSLDDKGIVSIGAGNEHSVFVTKSGKLYTSGYNDNGQCGVGTTQQVRQPTLVQSLEDEEIQQVFVFNGCEHTVALTKEGKIFSFGYNSRGQLGLGNTNIETIPRPVRALMSRKVVLAACSYYHSLFLCSDGALFACGRNEFGQLGHGDTLDKKTPQAILSAPRHIVSVSCGQYHTAMSTTQGVVYVCGKNDYGQLGMENSAPVKVLTKISTPGLDHVVQVCCGYYHTLILSSNGVTAGFGRNDYGQLGLGHALPRIFQPTMIHHLRDKAVTDLAAGCYHSVAITANGMLYVFGRNNYGQLATGDLDERHTPHPVDDFIGQKIISVSAGFYHTLVLVGNQSVIKTDISGLSSDVASQLEFSDSKQLSTLFLKDLELLGARVLEDSNRELVVECPAYVSSSDLLTILMKNVSCFISDASNENLLGDISADSVHVTLLSLSSLIKTSWNIISGKQSISFFAIAPEDMLRFLCKLVTISSRVLTSVKDPLKVALKKYNDIDLRSFDVPSNCVETELLISLSTLYHSDGDVPPIVDALQTMRDAFLTVFFELNASENALRIECDSFSSQLCELLSKEHEIFFSHPFLLLKFVIFLYHNSVMHSDDLSPDRISSLRLMRSVVKVYQYTDVVKALFETSLELGMELFSKLSNIHNVLSYKSMEKRLDAQVASPMNVETKKVVTEFEHALSSMLKVAVPLMFDYNGENERMRYLVRQIVIEMIQDACELLDLVTLRGLTDESLTLLRYGTLLPSILPTVLLYALGCVKKGKRIPNFSPSLYTLAMKLENMCKWEVMIARQKLLAEKKPEVAVSVLKKDGDVSAVSSNHDTKKDDELTDSIMEEILFVKRDHNQISWWFRLLKLSVVLLAKTAYNSEDCSMAEDSFDHNMAKFLYHDIWRHILVSDKEIQHRHAYEYVVQRMETNSSIGRTGPLQEVCVKFRECEKKHDAVYRMLNQPARAAVSGTIIQSLENMLFEGICSLQLSWVKEDVTQGRLFRKISKFSKLIFSKRSSLLANSSLSWTETLSNLEKLVEEVCSFVTSCYSSMRNLKLLPFPRHAKYSHRWRRVVLVIVCVGRWNKVMLKRPSKLRENALDFILQVTNFITADMTFIPSIADSAKKLHHLYCGLVKTTNEFDAIANAISTTARYYSQISFLSVKSDLLSTLTGILRETRLYTNHPQQSALCLSIQTYNKLRSAFSAMESMIRLALDQWLLSPSAFAMSDLQMINHLIKLQETLQIAASNSRSHGHASLSFVICTNIITKLFEKYHVVVNGQEEKSFISNKISSFRERNAASKRVLFSVLTYMHNIVLHDMDGKDVHSNKTLLAAADAYNKLLIYLQTFRNDEALATGDENLLANMGNEKDASTASTTTLTTASTSAVTASIGALPHTNSSPSMSPLPSSFNLLPAMPTVLSVTTLAAAASATTNVTGVVSHASTTGTATTSAARPVAKENTKKKCQDLIVKPMEFSKTCEGVVVAGEKLLNNCKGTDFSMATWVLVTNAGATGAKSSFLFGKISHNETWPTVLLKNDGKIEIILGHNNEFERTVSEATVPLLTWTHIAITCEQKKVKLFINGVLDAQIATSKGSNRAILFPLVMGTCPSQVRTRIVAVKEGFDGLIAQFKYFSRAISPIHVKIIYDHGPPELIDFSAKIIYHSLAALKCVYSKMDHSADNLVAVRRTMELCHLTFVTDTNRRNRYAALHVLRYLLLHFPISEFTLSGWKMRNGILDKVCQVEILHAEFLPRHLNLHQRFVLYFLRIVGLNWMQYYKPVNDRFVYGDTDDKDNMAIIEEIAAYAPRSCFSKGILDKFTSDSRTSTPATSLNDRLIAQEEPRGETSYQIVAMLHVLINGSDEWFTAAKAILEEIFSLFQNKWSSTSEVVWKPTKLSMIDLMGATQLLAGAFSGCYLGADVKNFFEDGMGKIIQINNTINGAVVLSTSSYPPKTIRLRLSDLNHDEDMVQSNDGRLMQVLLSNVLGVLNTLSPSMKLITGDCLCHGASATSFFQQKTFLRCSRPVEAFIFIRLLTAFVSFAPQLQQASNYPHLWDLLNDACMSSADLNMTDDNKQQQLAFTQSTISRNCSPLTFHWFQSMKFFSLLPERMLLTSFPIDQDERLFIDFVNKQQGIQDDMKTIGRQISTGGLFIKTMLANVPHLLDNFDISKFEMNYLVSDKSSVSRTYSMKFDSALSDADCVHAWSLMQMLRTSMIRMSRMVVRQTIGIVGYAMGPFGTEEVAMVWRLFVSQTTDPKNWIHAETLNAILQSNLIQQSLHDIVNATTRTRVTHFLTSAVKFAAMTMLLPAAYKANDNILLSTDFFVNLTRNLYLWLEYNVDAEECDYLVQCTLKELLPCIPHTENAEIKQIIMQVCVYFVRRFLSHSRSPSKSLVDMARSNYFNVIRTSAMEQIVKFKGHHLNNISPYAYNLTQLVAGLELIQRQAGMLEQKELLQVISGSKVQATNNLAKIQTVVTSVPKIISIRQSHVDLDLTACIESIWSAELLDMLKGFGEEKLCSLKDNMVVEVALGIGAIATNDNPVFETVFCGSSQRLLQSGLMPDTIYQLKCRAYLGAIPLAWSTVMEFCTEKGTLFTFDFLQCGPDIILAEDGMMASYAGDDTWSTVLGSRSFSSGVTHWEMKINQTSTAYIFVGVATSAADLNSFLGGCVHGWGFIGEQALYHNREKVKVYGEAFSTGDVIGVTLDLNVGTISFSKNKRNLGVAFDKICGDLYPAVAFYNAGQEISILHTGFKTSCAHEPIPISPTRLSMDDISILNEMVLSIYAQTPMSHRLAMLVAEHCNQWCTTSFVRCRAISKKDVFLAKESPLLKRFSLVVGERVRTFYGVAEVAGVAFNRIWFKVNPEGEVWFFTNQQISEGRAKKLFMQCSYSNTDDIPTTNKEQKTVASTGADTAYALNFDASTVMELLESSKWSLEMDEVLTSFLVSQSEKLGIEAWKITSEQIYAHFRTLQQSLGRVILPNTNLTQKWGIVGPKRKAVLARLGLLRILNQMLDMYLPFLISDNSSTSFESNRMTVTDEFVPQVETFGNIPYHVPAFLLNSHLHGNNNRRNSIVNRHSGTSQSLQNLFDAQEQYFWPTVVFTWDNDTQRVATAQELWLGPLNSLRRLIFSPLKLNHFFEVLKKTATRPAKTEDDYDYPDNLPHVKINRLKAFRAREVADMLHLPGDDLMLSTMFGQLWKELRQHNAEKLRISYTHPMDDGQSRTFKIKFEGEGVDDYGGPYREIFQQICTELQLLKPLNEISATVMEQTAAEAQMSSVVERKENSSTLNESMMSTSGFFSPQSSILNASFDGTASIMSVQPAVPSDALPQARMVTLVCPLAEQQIANSRRRCFLPLLLPTPNWNYDKDCTEKYKFMFHPAATSLLKQEMYYFMGQMVGIAARSRITLDLSFPSYIWKCVVGERVTEKDLASFDQSAYDLVHHLQVLYQHYQQDLDMRLHQVSGESHTAGDNNNYDDSETCKEAAYDESVTLLSTSIINSNNATVNISKALDNSHNNSNNSNHDSANGSKQVLRRMVAYDEAVNVSALDDPSSSNPAVWSSTVVDTSVASSVAMVSSSVLTEQQQTSIVSQPNNSVTFSPPQQSQQQASYMSHLSYETHGDDYGLDVLEDLTWSVTRSDGVVVDLTPQGRYRSVDIQDLGQFLTLYVTARLNEMKMAITCFRRGLLSILPESAVTLLTWEELEDIVCGSRCMDVNRLKENTEYDDDVPPDEPHIQYFWDVLEEFDETEKSAFLKFVWARPSLPPNGVEFTQKMRILSAASEDPAASQDNFLPKAHTCFFSINLPRYSSKKIMAEKLRYAILNCTEMDGDFRTTESDVPGWATAMDQTLHAQQSQSQI